jgi:heme/copper-type cytochrome/quinol oxidase subunit 2
VDIALNNPAQDKNHFRALDRLFWLFWMFWIVLLLVLGAVLWFVFDPKASTEGLSTADLACLANMTLPSSLSAFGKTIYAILIASSFIFYSVCFAILHRAIRTFRAGYVFDHRTLNSLKWLGIVLIAFPFVQCLLEFVVLDFLERYEGAKFTSTGSVIDVGTMAFGLFVLALRQVLQHGLVIKSENDLTI